MATFGGTGMGVSGDIVSFWNGPSMYGPGNVGYADLSLNRVKAQGEEARRTQADRFAFEGSQAAAGRDQDRFLATLNSDTARRGQDFNLEAARLAQQTAFRGQDTQRDLGFGEQRTSREIAAGNNAAQRDIAGLNSRTQLDITGMNNAAQRELGMAGFANQRSIAELQADVARSGQASAYAAAQLPFQYRQGVFDRVFPMIQGLVGNSGPGAGPNTRLIGGQNTPLPELPPREVYNPRQIEQQVNAVTAQNDSRTAALQGRAAADAAGRGFSANSPLAMALQGQLAASGQAANTDLDRETRMAAAEANARQGLQVGQLAQQQWSDFNNADIDRRKAAYALQNEAARNNIALIGALAGFAG